MWQAPYLPRGMAHCPVFDEWVAAVCGGHPICLVGLPSAQYLTGGFGVQVPELS